MNTREQSNMNDYKNWVIQRAKELRMNPTESEVKFLNWVKKNYSSIPSSQYPIEVNGKWFILDFYFKNLNIAVEIDGSIHTKQTDKDKDRDKLLFEHKGIYTIRIDNKFCDPNILNERFESKIAYATGVLNKHKLKTGKIKKKKKNNKKQLQEYNSQIGKIMNWARTHTCVKEKDIKQFAINIYNKNQSKDYYTNRI